MKKLLVLMLVLGMASVANATVSFELESFEVLINSTGTFNVVSDDTMPNTNFVGKAPGLADTTGMVATSNAGPDSIIIESPYAYDGYWGIESKDTTGDVGDEIFAGIQFVGTVTAGASTGTYTIDLYADDFTTIIDSLDIVVIPEPATVALLGLGGLFLLRRRK